MPSASSALFFGGVLGLLQAIFLTTAAKPLLQFMGVKSDEDEVERRRQQEKGKDKVQWIDMYAKCGSLEDAISAVENMRFKDTQAWSTVIVTCAIHGQGPKAMSVFKNMKASQVQPDAVTLLGLLYAWNHSGMVDESLAYFHYMTDEYAIPPGIKHYGCIKDHRHIG
ncbi:hypothetical protein Sjap_016885 [Stephania japonica]|uniref:Pentatricopeptide repeat-containing protein n=1 Tax=Stephania japonica TaxID=461633 RepID=A0AAP0I587_9MAGN